MGSLAVVILQIGMTSPRKTTAPDSGLSRFGTNVRLGRTLNENTTQNRGDVTRSSDVYGCRRTRGPFDARNVRDAPLDRILRCEIVAVATGWEVQARYEGDADPIRTQLVVSIGAGRIVAVRWREAVEALGSFLPLGLVDGRSLSWGEGAGPLPTLPKVRMTQPAQTPIGRQWRRSIPFCEPNVPEKICPNDCHRNVARLSIERCKQGVERCQALREVQSMCLVECPYDGVLEADTVIV